MTICSSMLAAIDKRLAEKKTLEEIGCELCDAVDDPRGKAIRIIKAHRGEKFLKENAEWLGYDVKKSNNGKIGGENCQKDFAQKNSSIPEETTNTEKITPPVIQQSDNFYKDEVVYESDIEGDKEETFAPISCSSNKPPEPEKNEPDNLGSFDSEFIPTLNQVVLCPCGCGYGYCETNKKWYNQVQMARLDD